jgi:hypothetical protein
MCIVYATCVFVCCIVVVIQPPGKKPHLQFEINLKADMDYTRKVLYACARRSIAREWASSYVLPVGSGPERGML